MLSKNDYQKIAIILHQQYREYMESAELVNHKISQNLMETCATTVEFTAERIANKFAEENPLFFDRSRFMSTVKGGDVKQ